MIYSLVFLASIISLGANCSPLPDQSLYGLLTRAVPVPVLQQQDGGRIYTGEERHVGNIPKAEINAKSKEFYEKVVDAHGQGPPTRARRPNLALAHKHGDSIFYSSTMSTNPPGRGFRQPQAFVDTASAANNELKRTGSSHLSPEQKELRDQLRAGQTSFAHRTQPFPTVVADPKENFAKCAEAGTCRMVEAKHGANVDMTGDKISSYGTHGIPGQKGMALGHIHSCISGDHAQFNCAGVGNQKGLDDVNRPGRPDSAVGQTPPAQPGPRRSRLPIPANRGSNRSSGGYVSRMDQLAAPREGRGRGRSRILPPVRPNRNTA